MKSVRNVIVIAAMIRVDDALRHRQRRSGEAEDARHPALLDRVLDLLDDLILPLQEAELPLPFREVVHVARDGVREVVHLADERGDERRGDADDDEQREGEHDRHGGAATLHPAALEAFHGRVERHREEERDEQPDDQVACGGEQSQGEQRRQHEPDHEEDRARREADHALHHGEDRTGVGGRRPRGHDVS